MRTPWIRTWTAARTGAVKRRCGAVAAALVFAGSAAPAAAAPAEEVRVREAYVSLRGADAPGPAAADRIRVLKAGSPRARQVLVLEPGQFAAAGSLAPVARELAARLPDTEVWAVDRREQNLADLDGFRRPPDRAADHYLGGHYRSRTPQSVPYVGEWGLALELADLREVVSAARDGGRRRVVLGGHSWGGTIALAYAGWDFDGRPGYRDLSGLVLLDAGVHDAFAGEGVTYRLTAEQAQAWRARIEGGEVFDEALNMGRTETYAILMQLAGGYANAAPDRPSTLVAHLPSWLRPPDGTAVTNLGLVEWLYATHPMVPDISINPEFTPPATLARALASPEPALYQWYWPSRLTLDLQAADPFDDTAVARGLGLRLRHTREIDVPLYSFQTGLTHGTVNTSARWVVGQSRITSATYAENESMTHLDPLFAAPGRNTFVDTVVPFLTGLGRR
ncbi:alpha/beta hydrolase [Streptomyces sp. NPDC091371]|uniref:alpha/beta hydrolase n=1 Tax=Streptomyces sp. NPDC091371 TaxID=3155303 RepID=UPI003449762B